MLQDNLMFLLTNPVFLRQIVQVVDGQYKLPTLSTTALQLLLGGGMPQVNRRKSLTKIFVILSAVVTYVHQRAIVLVMTRRQQEMEPQRGIFHLRVPCCIILGNLAKSTRRITNITQVKQDSFLFHSAKVQIS